MDENGNDSTIVEHPKDLIGKSIGRFKITSFIGRGGMGEVYKADDPLLKRSVAVKRVSPSLRQDPNYRQQLIREAERASQLSDENITLVYDVIQSEEEIFLIMEYVDGETLRDRMRRGINFEESLDIALQIAKALATAHKRGIVHRDIKPENIMITAAGQVKVCDFGLASHLRASDATTVLESVKPNVLAGTPAYMAPEVILGGEVDGRSDVFSLGIVFYESFTGRHPFRGANDFATIDKILHFTPSFDETSRIVPPQFAAVVAKMLEKDPRKRYEDAVYVLEALKNVPHTVEGVKVSKKGIVAVLLVLTLFAALLFTVRHRSSPPAILVERTLVVLPFRSIGASADVQAYSDGLTDALTARLVRLSNGPNIAVTPASEVRARNVTTADGARKLFGATLILAGTLHKSGNTLRVIFSLYEVSTLRQIAADTIETGNSAAFGVEDRIVAELMDGLRLPDSAGASPKRSNTAQAGDAYDHYITGRGYLQRPRTSENIASAIDAFEAAVHQDPKFSVAYASLGQAYWSKYEITKDQAWVGEAQSACQSALDTDRGSPEGATCLGTIQLGTGNYSKAAGLFETTLKLDPSSDDAYLGLARALDDLGEFDHAEKMYLQAVALKPKFFLGYARLADFYVRRTRYNDAVEQLKKEIAIVPDNDRAYRSLGGVFIFQARYDEAIGALKKSIELRPTIEAYSNLGGVYLRLRRFPDAAGYLQQAIMLGSNNYVVVGNLARALYWSNRDESQTVYDRAIYLGQKELEINPRNADVHILLSRYYAMENKRAQALQHLTRALSLNPRQAEYLSIAAVVHNQFGNTAEALKYLSAAVAKGWPTDELKNEIEFDNLADDSRFRQIIGESHNPNDNSKGGGS